MEVSDLEGELDKSSAAHSLGLVIARVDTTFEKKEGMALNLRKGLRDLMAGRNKGSSSKDVPKSQVPPSLPPPPTIDLSLILIPNLKKKRKEQELEEGEVVPQKETEQQKIAKDPKDKRASSTDNMKEHNGAEVRIQQYTWSPWLEVDSATIPYNASIREFQQGHFAHIAEALEKLLLLPKDMDALRCVRQSHLFLSLKKDLAMVSP